MESTALEAASSRIRGRSCTLSGWASPWECRAAQSRQVRLREAEDLSWGTALKGALTMLAYGSDAIGGIRKWSCACMVKRRGMGGFGGGWLEHPRRWLGSRWLGLALGVPICLEPPGTPEEAWQPSWGSTKGGL